MIKGPQEHKLIHSIWWKWITLPQMSNRWNQARQIKLQKLEQLHHIQLTLKHTLQVGTILETKCRYKDEKRWTLVELSAAIFRLSIPLIFYTALLQTISTFCAILDIVLRFVLGKMVKIISNSVKVTPTTIVFIVKAT